MVNLGAGWAQCGHASSAWQYLEVVVPLSGKGKRSRGSYIYNSTSSMSAPGPTALSFNKAHYLPNGRIVGPIIQALASLCPLPLIQLMVLY